ncbi:Na(+)/H(+) exchange regulatory cofactor NHE-RF3-like [Clarias magur]|uniref:Na(+)/H(+) exchange regulatory cofactor NHE-RF3-like n=1 Tax=Clarias magur TaxID=1594786 RepID=A0A8J4X7W1_CLAMG|nr:Na(+)/H(+) exchange regulatory cofactor NHE-RF3-like [Clarias magur]
MELTDSLVFNPKQGVDNPAMVVIEEDAGKVSGPLPRVCVLKREDGESFGFTLHLEKGRPGHVIRKVESMGVAERSGLKDGDRLLEVNEQFVDDVEHVEVVRRIRVSGPQLCLLLLGSAEYEQAVAQGWNLKELCKAQRGEEWKPPRLCHIIKNPASGLGFSINAVEGEKGKFSITPVHGGPAEKAGLRRGDRLVWINGALACELTHSAINKMLKKCSDHMTVLVVDSKSEQSYISRKMAILPAMADAQSMPYKPKRVQLVQGPDGYGFLLRHEKMSTGRKVHMVREVDVGSPAEVADFKDRDILMEVNGESVEYLSHEEVVSKIRDSGQQVSFTTITHESQDFYKKLGLSPLMFCEDHNSGMEQQEKLILQKESPAPLTLLESSEESQEELKVEPKPRLCVLQRSPVGFGFHLGWVQQKPGTFINQVTPGGPGESSGLLQGDVLVEVNGQNVEDECLEEVILLMKKGGSSLSLLVMDRPGYERKKKNENPITAEKVTSGEVQDHESSSVIQQSDSSEFLPEDLGNADFGSMEQQSWEACDFTGGDF